MGASVETEYPKGTTALMLSANEGHLDVVRYLVGAGANIERKCDKGTTALMHAAWTGRLDVVRYLVGAGANREVMCKKHHTALTLAIENNHLSTVEYLNSIAAEKMPVNIRAADSEIIKDPSSAPEVAMDYEKISLFMKSFDDLGQNIATRDDLGMASDIDGHLESRVAALEEKLRQLELPSVSIIEACDLVQDSRAETSASSSPAAFFANNSISRVEFQELKDQLKLLKKELACLKESKCGNVPT